MDFENFLPYLVNRAGAGIAVKFARDLKPHGISLQEWRVLAALDARGEIRVTELANATSIERTTLTRVLDKMETRDILARSRSPKDAREIRVALSKKGRALAAAIMPMADRYEATALEGIDPRESEKLKIQLRKIYENIGKL